MEIFDGAGVNDTKIEKFQKKILELFRPRANFGGKEKVELQTFVNHCFVGLSQETLS